MVGLSVKISIWVFSNVKYIGTMQMCAKSPIKSSHSNQFKILYLSLKEQFEMSKFANATTHNPFLYTHKAIKKSTNEIM